MRTSRKRAAVVMAVALAFTAAACGDGDDPSMGTDDDPVVATSTTAAGADADDSTATTDGGSELTYGQPCTAGSHPDCIDPDGPEGESGHVYLRGGAECMDDPMLANGQCSDLDGDGSAGYPDSG